LIRAAVVTLALFLLLGGCLFGAAGQLSWPMAWAVLGVFAVSKAATLAFIDPELIVERAAPGPGVDRVQVRTLWLGIPATRARFSPNWLFRSHWAPSGL